MRMRIFQGAFHLLLLFSEMQTDSSGIILYHYMGFLMNVSKKEILIAETQLFSSAENHKTQFSILKQAVEGCSLHLQKLTAVLSSSCQRAFTAQRLLHIL